MSHDDADRISRHLDDPHALCDDLGLLTGRRGLDWNTQAGRGVTLRCLWHDERSPSLSVSRGPDGTIRANCFGCGATGNVFDLIAASQGWDKRARFRDVLDVAADLARLPRPERRDAAPRPAAVKPMDRPPPPPEEPLRDEKATAQVAALLSHLAPVTGDAAAMAYLRSRGLGDSEEALGWYALPTGDARDGIVEAIVEEIGRDAWMRSGLSSRVGRWASRWAGPRLVTPWRDPDGNVTTLQGRLIGEAAEGVQKFAFAWGHGPRWPQGCERLRRLDPSAVVAVTEGAIDAASFNVIARRSRAAAYAVALPSVSSVRAWDRAWFGLFDGRRCAAALDNDDAGKMHTPALVELLSAVAAPGGVSVLVPKGAKDWNDVLRAALRPAAQPAPARAHDAARAA